MIIQRFFSLLFDLNSFDIIQNIYEVSQDIAALQMWRIIEDQHGAMY